MNNSYKNLAGKTVAITGATGGLGTELCVSLAKLGADLILLNRNREKTEQLNNILIKTNPKVKIKNIYLDLENFDSVELACEQLKKENINILIHNAGAYSIPRRVTSLGYDNVFQINFTSPYFITKQLLPVLRQNKNSKVVVVGSIAHNYLKTSKTDIDLKNQPKASLVYGNSKRYLMFAHYKLFETEPKVSLAVCHPGITFTNITAHYPKFLFLLIKNPMKIIFMKPKKAVKSIVEGCFDSCDYNRWIGPEFFNIWGKPKKQVLKTVSREEAENIFETAEQVYNKMVNISKPVGKG